MAERLSWEEITERYPDQWVLIVDLDEGPLTFEPRSGVVAARAGEREAVDAAADALPPPRNCAVYFTGPLVAPGIAFAL